MLPRPLSQRKKAIRIGIILSDALRQRTLQHRLRPRMPRLVDTKFSTTRQR